MDVKRIGVIGYGEVGQALTEGLSAVKDLSIAIFDIRFGSEETSNELRSLAKAQDLTINNDVKSLVAQNDMILSAVPGENAVLVAEESSLHMDKGKIYVDLNTVTPRLKIAMNEFFQKRGAVFIEVAILGTIASYGFKSPMLACGEKAKDFAGFLNGLGFKVDFLSEEIGMASYMKMLRSVFAKGVESLLFEMLVAAQKCDLLNPVMQAIVDHMDSSSFLQIAETWITTNVIHAKRRAEEMDHVIETLNNLGINPIMSEATKKRLEKCSNLNLIEQFGGRKPSNFQSVIESMVKQNWS